MRGEFVRIFPSLSLWGQLLIIRNNLLQHHF